MCVCEFCLRQIHNGTAVFPYLICHGHLSSLYFCSFPLKIIMKELYIQKDISSIGVIKKRNKMNTQELTIQIKQKNITDMAEIPGQIVLSSPLAPRIPRSWIFYLLFSYNLHSFAIHVYINKHIWFACFVFNRHSIMRHVFYLTCFYAWYISLRSIHVDSWSCSFFRDVWYSHVERCYDLVNGIWLNYQGNIWWRLSSTSLGRCFRLGVGEGSLILPQAICSQPNSRFPSAKWVDPDHKGPTGGGHHWGDIHQHRGGKVG